MKEIIQRQLFDYLQTLGVKNLVGVPDSTMKHFIDQGLKKNKILIMMLSRFMWEDLEKGVFRNYKRN